MTLPLFMCTAIPAATVTWTGTGPDMLASTASNWVTMHTPGDGDTVLFNETSGKDCMWDFTVSLNALMVTSEYSGTITISPSASLILREFIEWSGGGTDSLASNPANWAGNKLPQSNDAILFEGTDEDCIWDLEISPHFIRTGADYGGTITVLSPLSIPGNLTVDGGILLLNGRGLTVSGAILIGTKGTIQGGSSIIVLNGNWENRGTFHHGTSSVILNGSNQIISGNSSFYNLAKNASVEDSLYFEADTTQIIINNLTLQGKSNNLLSLRSTAVYQQWAINPQGSRTIEYIDVKDSNNVNSVMIPAPHGTDSLNNTGWNFGNDQCSCLWNRGLVHTCRSDGIHAAMKGRSIFRE